VRVKVSVQGAWQRKRGDTNRVGRIRSTPIHLSPCQLTASIIVIRCGQGTEANHTSVRARLEQGREEPGSRRGQGPVERRSHQGGDLNRKSLVPLPQLALMLPCPPRACAPLGLPSLHRTTAEAADPPPFTCCAGEPAAYRPRPLWWCSLLSSREWRGDGVLEHRSRGGCPSAIQAHAHALRR